MKNVVCFFSERLIYIPLALSGMPGSTSRTRKSELAGISLEQFKKLVNQSKLRSGCMSSTPTEACHCLIAVESRQITFSVLF